MAISFRVKVYELNQNSGSWVDQGTGVVSIKYLQNVLSMGLQVVSDEPDRLGNVVLETKVCVSQDVYRRQGDTIITWTDDYLDKKELALSFQDKDAAQEIWNKLCNIQGWVTSTAPKPEGKTKKDQEKGKENVESKKENNNNGPNDGFKGNGDADEGNEQGDDNVEENSNSAQSQGGDADQNMSYKTAVNELPEPVESSLKDILVFFDQLVGTAAMVKEFYAHLVLDPNYSEIKAEQTKEEKKDANDNASSNRSFEAGKSYLANLLQLFDALENEKKLDSLHMLFEIVKAVALLNEPKLFQFLLSDEYFMKVVGILEYDPDLHEKPLHREYIKKHVKHRQVIPVTDPEILEKVHQNFRISFFKDVLLPRALDESTFALLGDMELMNGIEIATAFHGDAEFLGKLFTLLKAKDTPKEKRAETVAFIQDLCNLAKKMQVPSRHAFYRSLIEKSGNFFGTFADILADEESTGSERVHVGDILKLSLEHDPELLRSYILDQKRHPGAPPEDANVVVPVSDFAKPEPSSDDEKKAYESDKTNGGNFSLPLMAQLIKRLVYDPEPGMQAQSCDVLRIMLDPETMEVNEKENFLNIFYKHYIQWLVYPLNFAGKENASLMYPDKPAEEKTAEDVDHMPYKLTLHREKTEEVESQSSFDSRVASLKRSRERRKRLETERVAHHHITELLSFCVQTHGYRIKYFVLRNCIVSKVLKLLHSKDKHLVLDAIRFVRTCVGLKDDFYNRFLVRDDYFQGLFAIFLQNGPRNNLINSSIIEMVEFIRMENIKKLVSYIVEKYGDVLAKVDYVDTYPALKAVYDKNMQGQDKDFNQNNDKQPVKNVKPAGQAFGAYGQLRAHEEDDEYFSESSNKKTEQKTNDQENGHKGPVATKQMSEECSKESDSSSKFVPRSSVLVPYDDDDEDSDDIPFAKTSKTADKSKREREDKTIEQIDMDISKGPVNGTEKETNAPIGKRRKVQKMKISFDQISNSNLISGDVTLQGSEDNGRDVAEQA